MGRRKCEFVAPLRSLGQFLSKQQHGWNEGGSHVGKMPDQWKICKGVGTDICNLSYAYLFTRTVL
jgi:hypothetical protein